MRAALAADTMKEFMQEYYKDETWEAFNKRRAAAAAAAAADAADPAAAARRREEFLVVRELITRSSIGFDTEIVNKVLLAILEARSTSTERKKLYLGII